MKTLVIFTLLFLLGLVVLARAQQTLGQVSLQWSPPTEQPERVEGYKLYYGTSSRSYDSFVDVGMELTGTVGNLQLYTQYYFAVVAYSSYGESAYSNEVRATAVQLPFMPISLACTESQPNPWSATRSIQPSPS